MTPLTSVPTRVQIRDEQGRRRVAAPESWGGSSQRLPSSFYRGQHRGTGGPPIQRCWPSDSAAHPLELKRRGRNPKPRWTRELAGLDSFKLGLGCSIGTGIKLEMNDEIEGVAKA